MHKRRFCYEELFEFEILEIGRTRDVENSEGPHSKTFPYLKGLGCTGSLKIQTGK